MIFVHFVSSRLLPVVAASVLTSALASCAAAPPSKPASRCTGLCASHEDGYLWAQRQSLLDRRACKSGYPAAFTQGCLDEIEDYREVHAYINDENHESEQ